MKRNLVVMIGFLMILSLGGCARNPVTGQQELAFMSVERQIEIGRQQYPLMTQMYDGELKDPKLQKYVSDLGNQLARVSQDPDLPYEFNVVNSSIPNAYALPGGFISVTRGLLLQMDSEDELAAVIGHEIAHAVARHSSQQYSRNVIAGILLTAGEIFLRSEGVANAALYGDLAGVGAQAMLASYSRSQEQQADRLGILYMAKAGYPPEGMVALQQILLNQRKRDPNVMEQIFSTHPLSEDRIEDSRATIKNVRKIEPIPEQNQLKTFKPIVDPTWTSRRGAYDRMDRGIELMTSKDYARAAEQFREAIDRYSSEALFHAWLGIALTQIEGEDRAGRKALDRALSLNKEVFRVWYYSGINHHDLEKYGACVKDMQKAERLLPGVRVPEVERLKQRCQQLKKS